MKHLAHALILGLAPHLAGAATTGEEARFEINAINGNDFEVIEQQQMGPTEFWCAAASYNELRQGRSETIRLYVRSPRGPAVTRSGKRGVVFTTNPSGLPADPGRMTISVSDAGASLKSAQARRFCRDAFTRSTK